MTDTMTQSTTVRNNDEEVTTKSALLNAAIDNELITLEAFNLYVGARLQEYLYESISEIDLKTLYKDVHTQANEELKTAFKIPRYKMYTNRLKRCAHCNDLYFDLSVRNQTTCCNKKIAFNDGKVMYRNNVILSECYRQYCAKNRRKTTDSKSVAQFRVVPINSFFAVMDENGNIVTNGKRRRQDEPTSLPVFDEVRGVFDKFWNVKNQDKYDALDDYTKAAVTPSDVTVYTIEEFNKRFNTDY